MSTPAGPSEVRVRFAPSPTGYLHVGGARTALFDWLFARQHNGTFILRIEDTDVERSSEEMTRGILDAMTWLGLHWDEGPYFQSKRLDLYRELAERLVSGGHAYLDEGAIRFRVPEGRVTYQDAVFGEISVESDTIENFVLLRSDKHPTYHLSVVVDDIDMRISHVIRGADHISNTPKQILLYRALGASLPVFAHLPLILGPDKTRLSKRHGATSVSAYQEQGILPEAMRNFLALLGWAPGNDQEMFDDEALIQAFSLQGISKANAVFNPEKLAWFNAQYIARLPHDKVVEYLRPEYAKVGLWRDSFEKEDREWFRSLIDLYRPRAKVLQDFPRQSRIFLTDHVEFDPTAVEKFLKDETVRGHLRRLADRLAALPEFNHHSIEEAVRGLANELGVKPGVLMNPARVALTGQSVAPGLFDVMVLFGRENTVQRLRLS
ncbi:MAG: glutamate--tRNA ligase [Acidobacteria bacterium]|nr:MAG: glutamate--tRNA ligase [Acidobacteriota bacterium]